MAKISAPMNPTMILEQLNKANTKTKKKNVIKKAWESDSEGFFVGIQIALDNTFEAIKKVPAWDGDDPEPGTLTMEEFYDTIQNIKHGKVKDVSTTVKTMAEQSGTNEWNKWYRRILTKEIIEDLPMDIVISTLELLLSPKKPATKKTTGGKQNVRTMR